MTNMDILFVIIGKQVPYNNNKKSEKIKLNVKRILFIIGLILYLINFIAFDKTIVRADVWNDPVEKETGAEGFPQCYGTTGTERETKNGKRIV